MSDSMTLRKLLSEHTDYAAAELVRELPDGDVRCLACAHRCLVKSGKAGVCQVRFNEGGQLRVPWGYVSGLQVDPIEKKPFYHAFPGRDALSFGMVGCDLHCSFCQNWVTSQVLRDDRAVANPRLCSSEQLVSLAVEHGAPVMVSTYNEPLITAEWALAAFKLAKEEKIVCGMVSNGNATREVLELLRPYMDLYKIDLKGFDDQRYRQLGTPLDCVLDGIRMAVELGYWVEVVTLLVPGFNDREEEIKRLTDFLAEVSADIPWHVTAFHPDYKMDGPSRTPVESLLRAHEIGVQAGLKYVYVGNIAGAVGDREDTKCAKCGSTMIRRIGFNVVENNMSGSCCGKCGAAIPGVWEEKAPKRRDGGSWPTSIRMC